MVQGWSKLVPCLGFGRGRRLCHALVPGSSSTRPEQALQGCRTGHSTQSIAPEVLISQQEPRNPGGRTAQCSVGDLGVGWDLYHSPSFQGGEPAPPSSECTSAPSSHCIPFSGKSLSCLRNVGREAQCTLQGSAAPSEPHSPRARPHLGDLQPCPCPGDGPGAAAARQGEAACSPLPPLGKAGTFPASCPCRENPHTSNAGEGGKQECPAASPGKAEGSHLHPHT